MNLTGIRKLFSTKLLKTVGFYFSRIFKKSKTHDYFISIIIPTYNEEKYLGNLLDDLRNQTYKKFEIIISDAFSNDKTRDIAKYFNAIVVDGGKPSVGRNNGAFIAKGDIIVFLDADVRIKNNFIEQALSSFLSKQYDLASGLFDTSTKSLFFKCIYGIWNLSKILRQFTNNPDADGQFLMFKTNVFKDLNGFRVELVIGEDADIVQRAKKMGYKFGVLKVKYIPSERRYKKVGFVRVAIGSLLGGISASLNIKILQRISEKIYGGMGSK